jgi:hypothetical protein
MRDGELLFPGLIILLILLALVLDPILYHHGPRVLGFPVALGLVTAGLCAWRLRQRWGERQRQGEAGGGRASIEPASALPAAATLRAMLGLVVAVPLVWLLGFIVGLPLYVGAYIKWRGGAWPAALIGAAIALAAALGFIKLLGMPQPHGPLVWP